MDFFFGWLAKKILDKAFSQLTSKDLQGNLRDTIDSWAKRLPSEFELHSSAIATALDQDDTERPKLDLVFDKIDNLRIPSSAMWLDALLEHWNIVREKVGENAARFFLIDERQASEHLSGLADSLSRVCQKNKDLYNGELLYSVKSLDRDNPKELAEAFGAVMLPPCPSLVIGREDDFVEIKRRFGISVEVAHPYTVLRGLPGVGKTTFAFKLAHDEQIKNAFPDGILWTHLDIINREIRNPEGEQSSLINKLADWGRALGNNGIQSCRNPDEAAGQLRSLLHNKRMLLIVDDVWDSAHGEVFKVGGPGCVTLITTRETKIAEELVDSSDDDVYLLGKLTDDKAYELLQTLAPSIVQDFPNQCLDLIHELEGLPLSLQVAGRLLNREVKRGFSPTDLIEELKQGVALLAAKAPANRPGVEEDRTMLTVTILLAKSTDRLDTITRERFAMLGPFAPKPATFDLSALQYVWDTEDADDSVKELIDRGLLELQQGIYCLHSLLVKHANDLLETL